MNQESPNSSIMADSLIRLLAKSQGRTCLEVIAELQYDIEQTENQVNTKKAISSAASNKDNKTLE
jgi:hypothetical protein